MRRHISVFDMKDFPLGPPHIEDDLPSPPPLKITMWVEPWMAGERFPERPAGRAGIELVFDLRSDPTQEVLEYEVGEPRPIDVAIRCEGGDCRLPAHEARTVFRTFTGRNLCYAGYVAFLGERH